MIRSVRYADQINNFIDSLGVSMNKIIKTILVLFIAWSPEQSKSNIFNETINNKGFIIHKSIFSKEFIKINQHTISDDIIGISFEYCNGYFVGEECTDIGDQKKIYSPKEFSTYLNTYEKNKTDSQKNIHQETKNSFIPAVLGASISSLGGYLIGLTNPSFNLGALNYASLQSAALATSFGAFVGILITASIYNVSKITNCYSTFTFKGNRLYDYQFKKVRTIYSLSKSQDILNFYQILLQIDKR